MNGGEQAQTERLNAGMLGQAASDGRKPGEIQMALKPMEHSYDALDNLIRKVIMIGDRLGGVNPPEIKNPTTEVDPQAQPNVLSQVHRMCVDFSGLVTRLDNATARLEDLV